MPLSALVLAVCGSWVMHSKVRSNASRFLVFSLAFSLLYFLFARFAFDPLVHLIANDLHAHFAPTYIWYTFVIVRAALWLLVAASFFASVRAIGLTNQSS
jgi:hypothetical protein